MDTLEGTSQPFVAYTPEIFIGRSPHNGVTTPLPSLEPGNNVVVYHWTVTDSSQPLDVALQPTTLTKPEFASQTLIPTGSNEVTLTFNLNRIGDASSAQVQGEVTLNGQHLANIDSTTNPDLANLLPLFRCTRSGHYHLTMTHNGTVEVDEDYVQRSLAWETPWPSIENGDVNSPIAFTNRLVWKVGDEVLPTNSDQPRWRARFPGDSFPLQVAGQDQPYQDGSQPSFTWDPSSLELSARGVTNGRFRLVPSDAGVEESGFNERLREEVQAREPQTTFEYAVEADAVTFEHYSPVLRQRVNASGLVPGKVRQVYIENARFEPDPPVPELPLTFRADIFSFFFDEPEIRWQLVLVNEDEGLPVKSFGPTDWVDFTAGYLLQAEWDRTDASGQPVPPGSYRGDLLVEVREKTKRTREGNPIVVSAVDLARVFTGAKSLAVELSADPASLESGQTASVSLRAFATVRGLEPVPPIRWTSTVFSPSGAEISVNQSAAGTQEFNTVWDPRGPDGSPLPDGTYQIKAVAEIPGDSLRAEKTLFFAIGDSQGVTVENLAVDPSPVSLAEEGMEGGLFTADIIPIGFTESFSAPWILKITREEDGAVVRSLSGQVNILVAEEGAPTPFEVFWDARKTDGSLVERGTYSARLVVDPCGSVLPEAVNGADGLDEEPPVAGCAGQDLLALQVGDPILQMLEDTRLFADSSRQTAEDLNRIEISPRYSLDLRILAAPLEVRPEVRVAVMSRLNQGGESTILRGAAIMSGQMAASAIIQNNDENDTLEFSSIDWSAGIQPTQDSTIFVAEMRARGGVQYGRAIRGGDATKILGVRGRPADNEHFSDDVIDIQKAGMRCFESAGYTILDFFVRDPSWPTSREKVVARVENTADVVYLSGHGSYTNWGTDAGNIILADRTGPRPVNAFGPEQWRKINTLIVAGCVACNLNDYAYNIQKHVTGGNPDLNPVSSPARTLKAVLKPGAVMLGYQEGAPESPFDQPLIRGFFNDMGPSWYSLPSLTPLLWVRGHARRDVLDNASAIDSSDYYFITHGEKRDPKYWHPLKQAYRQRVYHTKRQIMRVPSSEWDKPLKSLQTFQVVDDDLPDVSFEIVP